MFTTLRNAWKIPELRKKLLFVLLILLIYRIGNAVPVPYVNVELLNEYFNANLSDTVLGLLNAMSGAALSRATVLALSIQPYINASIIIQLLTVAIPALERLAKDGGPDAMLAVMSDQAVASCGNPGDVEGRELRHLVIATKNKLAKYPDVANFADLGYPELDELSMWRGYAVFAA